jgi:hypothetical protein
MNIQTEELNVSLQDEDNLDINLEDEASLNINLLVGIPIGMDDYNHLRNKPKIEGVTLEGDKTYEELNMNRLTNIELENILQ